jgi:hypothetical protein
MKRYRNHGSYQPLRSSARALADLNRVFAALKARDAARADS